MYKQYCLVNKSNGKQKRKYKKDPTWIQNWLFPATLLLMILTSLPVDITDSALLLE